MWKFERKHLWLAAGLAASAAHADFMNVQRRVDDMDSRNKLIGSQQDRLRKNKDSEELRTAIDDSQALFDALALESGRLGEDAHKELYADLREGYHLAGAVDAAHRALAFAEELVRLKGGIKTQQERIAATAIPDREPEESRLLGLQSDQLALVEDLRRTLRGLHKDLNEDQIRDLRNWAMVNEGLLRRRHEEEDLRNAAQKEAEALTGTGQALESMAVPEELSATAAPVPAAGPTPAKAKAAKQPKAGAKVEADPR